MGFRVPRPVPSAYQKKKKNRKKRIVSGFNNVENCTTVHVRVKSRLARGPPTQFTHPPTNHVQHMATGVGRDAFIPAR